MVNMEMGAIMAVGAIGRGGRHDYHRETVAEAGARIAKIIQKTELFTPMRSDRGNALLRDLP